MSTQFIAETSGQFSKLLSHILKKAPVLELEDPPEQRRDCQCESELFRIRSDSIGLLICSRQFYYVRCISFKCLDCGIIKRYVSINVCVSIICMFNIITNIESDIGARYWAYILVREHITEQYQVYT